MGAAAFWICVVSSFNHLAWYILSFFSLLTFIQSSWGQWQKKSVQIGWRGAAFLRGSDRETHQHGHQANPPIRKDHCTEWDVPCESAFGCLLPLYPFYWVHSTSLSIWIFSQVRVKLLARLVTQFEGGKKNDLLQFVLEDMRGRSELAFSLLFHEYNEYLSQQPSGSLDSYEHCLFILLSGLQEKPEQRDGWESPHNTTNY